jgi:hypothetical protein
MLQCFILRVMLLLMHLIALDAGGLAGQILIDV